MVVSLARFLVIVPLAVFEGGFHWSDCGGASWRGTARCWRALRRWRGWAGTGWCGAGRCGKASALESRQYRRYLWAGTPLAGCAAHLAWLRWREGAGTMTLRT